MTSVSDPAFWEKKRYEKENRGSIARSNTERMAKYAKPKDKSYPDDTEGSLNDLLSGYTNEQKEESSFNRFIPTTEQDDLSEMVGDRLLNTLWNNLYYLTSNLSTEAPGSPTTSTTTENVDAKDVDTSELKFLNPNRDSRFRINFYISAGAGSEVCYITSPATNTGFGSPAPLETTAAVGYVGIKIVSGKVNLVSKKLGDIKEKINETNKVIDDDSTHILEIIYRSNSSDVLFDGDQIGTIDNDLINGKEVKSVYTFLTSIKSANGTGVQLTIEGYEFAQLRGTR